MKTFNQKGFTKEFLKLMKTLQNSCCDCEQFCIPNFSDQSGKFLSNDGTDLIWSTVAAPGGFTSGSVIFANVDGVITQDNANFFYDNPNNRLGIGTNAPARSLDVRGDIDVNGHRIGRGNGNTSTNFGAGFGTLNAITTGNVETAVGYEAMLLTTTGIRNVAMGYQALRANTIGQGNTAIGYQALLVSNYGSFVGNTAVGAFTLNTANTNTAKSCAIGYAALFLANNPTSLEGRNNAFGYTAGQNVSTGIMNTLVGGGSGFKITTGERNTTLGNDAMGQGSFTMGGAAGSSASQCVALGFQALPKKAQGTGSIAVGYQALFDNNSTTGFNVAVGYLAGSGLATGDYNVILGGNTGSSITGLSNRIILADGQGNIRANVDNNGNWSIPNGNLSLATAGNKLSIATGANASIGTATLVAGTVTVATTAVVTASKIFLSLNTPGGTLGISYSAADAGITNGTSFVINSVSAAGAVVITDTSTINWWIIN